VTISVRARRLALVVGLLVGIGALGFAVAPDPSPTLDHHAASAEIAARSFGIAPNATRPTRSLRLSQIAALLSAAFLAALAVWTVTDGRSRAGRRRLDQFFARRRGPPVLLVAH
jgi:hypothetical protein